jgi:hypothetical protein
MRPLAGMIVFAVFAGCALPPQGLRCYTATLERRGERAESWDYLSPVKGHKPLHILLLRVNDPAEDRNVVLRVFVLDLISSDAYGQEGDRVSFLHSGGFPEGGAVEIEPLAGYRVIARKE